MEILGNADNITYDSYFNYRYLHWLVEGFYGCENVERIF